MGWASWMLRAILACAWIGLAPVAEAVLTGPVCVSVGEEDERRLTGRLEEVEGQRVLYLWGTPLSQGYAEGYLLAAEIQAGLSEFVFGEAGNINPKLWNGALRSLFQTRIRLGPTTNARIKGVVKGIAAKLSKEEQAFPQLGRPLDELDFVGVLALIDLAGFLCSSYVAWGEVLEEGTGPMVGRNLDYRTSRTMGDSTLVKVHMDHGKQGAWVELGWPGFMGCLTGISEHGVSVAIHDVSARAPAGQDRLTPRAASLAMLMDGIGSNEGLPDRAAEMLRKHHFGFGMNAMLAWTGDSPGGAVLEVDTDFERDQGVSVRGPDGRPFVACSNHHRLRVVPYECSRYATLESGCVAVLDLESDPLELETGWQLICRASKASTIYRCIFDLEGGALRFQRRSRPGGPMIEAVELNWRTLLQRGNKLREVLR